MTFSRNTELQMKAFDQAGQVALEFLRANRPTDPKEVTERYNQIFEGVYQHMIKLVGAENSET